MFDSCMLSCCECSRHIQSLPVHIIHAPVSNVTISHVAMVQSAHVMGCCSDISQAELCMNTFPVAQNLEEAQQRLEGMQNELTKANSRVQQLTGSLSEEEKCAKTLQEVTVPFLAYQSATEVNFGAPKAPLYCFQIYVFVWLHVRIYVSMYVCTILSLQMAALTSFFITKLKIISSGLSLSINRTKCVHEHVLIE